LSTSLGFLGEQAVLLSGVPRGDDVFRVGVREVGELVGVRECGRA